MPRRAFTLVELLIVISVIVVLMGLLFPAIALVRKQMKIAQTKTQIQQIGAALEKYRNVNAGYPDRFKPSGGTDDFDTVFGTATTGFTAASAVGIAGWQTINKDLVLMLETVDSDLKLDKNGFLADVWGAPLRYRPAKKHPFTASTPAASGILQIDSDNPPKGIADTYALWSVGPDGIDQYGEVGSDDILSWTR